MTQTGVGRVRRQSSRYMRHPFLTAWTTWEPDGPPYHLPADKPVLLRLDASWRNCHRSWRGYIQSHDFVAPDDRALHLGLLPQPFFGNPLKAAVIVLTLNPGVEPHDYYGEYRDARLRRAILASYQQPERFGHFMWLDPQ